MDLRIKFLGAAGTVTGSKYLVSIGSNRLLIDAGMFQGAREWRERNWNDPEVDLKSIDAVLLTHAHIDHTGILPRYVNLGLNCPVYATAATCALSKLLLTDSGRLQEEEASYRAERGKSRHSPPLPLYTEQDALASLALFKSVSVEKSIEILPGVSAIWRRMGHIIGACSIQLNVAGKRIVFSGDIGRFSVPILRDPQPVEFGDLLLIESTYGDRLHGTESPSAGLKSVINRTAKRGGIVVIPSFAVGRTQLLLYYLRELKINHQIPDIPVVIDSPMACDATGIYRDNSADYDPELAKLVDQGVEPFAPSKTAFVRDRSESIKLNSVHDPMILISASGMLTGGRILHHLKHRISDPLNTILFVGSQPPGSRGDWIKSGARSLRLVGDEVPIRAEVAELSSLSAHGDRDELLRWCGECSGTPGRVAVVHGEPASAQTFRNTLEEKFQWNAFVAGYLQEIEL